MISFSQWIFYNGFVVALIFPYQLYIILGMFLFRLLWQMLIFKKSMNRLCEKDLIFLAPFFEIILLFFYPFLALTKIFMKKTKWTMR